MERRPTSARGAHQGTTLPFRGHEPFPDEPATFPAELFAYFTLAFGISWSGVMLAASRGDLYLLLAAMIAGPAGTALALTAMFEGTRGLGALARRLVRWRVGLRWYAAVLVAPALLLLVLSALSSVSAGYLPSIATAPAPSAVMRDALIVGFGAGIFEEIGWTGFATPRLLRRFSWFGAGVVLGVPWALWHALPDYLGRPVPAALWIVHMLEWVVALAAFRIFMTWIYTHTRSLLVGILLHAGFTGGQRLMWPSVPPEGELVWYGVFAGALWLVVAAVVVFARRAHFPPPPPPAGAGVPAAPESGPRKAI